MYYIYVIRCEDNSLYTGITTNLKRRFEEHKNMTKKGAKYTKLHQVENVECVYRAKNKSLASKLEFYFKKLNKQEKENVILDKTYFNTYLADKIDTNMYKRIKGIKRLLK